MNDPYRPVPCAIHGACELAILRHTPLRMVWRAARREIRIEIVQPLDLRTRRGSEYMILRDGAGRRRIARLDRVRCADPVLVHRPQGTAIDTS